MKISEVKPLKDHSPCILWLTDFYRDIWTLLEGNKNKKLFAGSCTENKFHLFMRDDQENDFSS